MEPREFERLYGRTLTLDLCGACHAIWFDADELLQLTPGATLQLVTVVHERLAGAQAPLAARLACPRCGMRLVESHDLQRATRFTYHRCPKRHGRFLTFFQFLRAKNFVRSLDAGEVEALRTRIRQVNCSNCGAPVDVERNAACRFCRTPVAMLDPDQVRKAIDELRQAEEKRRALDPALPIELAAERLRAERAWAELGDARGWPALITGDGSDLVAAGLRALARLLSAR